VGYGGTDCFEGSAAAPATVNTIGLQRTYEGCFDTNDNSHDFVTGAPAPRNSSTPFHDCTALTAYGTANPTSVLQGESTTLTVYVAAGQNPSSTGLSVTADLSQIGGLPNQVFSPIGNDVFTFTQLVPSNNPPGLKSLPVTITDTQARVANATIGVKVLPLIADHITISQVYGGGGNAGASYSNDYVELYNPTNATVTITDGHCNMRLPLEHYGLTNNHSEGLSDPANTIWCSLGPVQTAGRHCLRQTSRAT
jgi:hypothetical protein